MRETLLFYCQHSLGIGHLTRSFALARALRERFRVVFLNGGRLPDGISVPDGVECIDLPPLGMDDGHTVVSRDAASTCVAARAERRRLIDQAVAATKPARAAGRAVPLRPQEVRRRNPADDPRGAGAGRARGLQPARHPGRCAARPAAPRRPRALAGRPLLRRRDRACRCGVREAAGQLPAERGRCARRCGTAASSCRSARRCRTCRAANTCWCRPAAASSATRCSAPRSTRIASRGGRCASSPGRSCPSRSGRRCKHLPRRCPA